MKKTLLLSLLLLAPLGCAPRWEASSLTPQIVQVDVKGREFTVQGRYFGSADSSSLWLSRNEDGQDATPIPRENILSWTDHVVRFTVPANFPAGGAHLIFRTPQGQGIARFPVSVP